MRKGRLRRRSGDVGFVYEFAFSEEDRLMYRFLDDEGNPRLDADGGFRVAPVDKVEYLIHHLPANLKQLCAESGIDFERFRASFLRPNRQRKR